jgi:hypothetical protein
MSKLQDKNYITSNNVIRVKSGLKPLSNMQENIKKNVIEPDIFKAF